MSSTRAVLLAWASAAALVPGFVWGQGRVYDPENRPPVGMTIYMSPEARRDAQAAPNEAALPNVDRIDAAFVGELRRWQMGQTSAPPGMYAQPPAANVLASLDTLAMLNTRGALNNADQKTYDTAATQVLGYLRENNDARNTRQQEDQGNYDRMKAAFFGKEGFSFNDAERRVGFAGNAWQLREFAPPGSPGKVLLDSLADAQVRATLPHLLTAPPALRQESAFSDPTWGNQYRGVLDRALAASAQADANIYPGFDAALPKAKLDALDAQVMNKAAGEALLASARSEVPGLLLAEGHSDGDPKKLLIDNLPALKAQGVNTLYLESLQSSESKPHLDAYFAAPAGAPLPDFLDRQLRALDKNLNLTDSPGSFRNLVLAAKANGVRVVALDDEMCKSGDTRPKPGDPTSGMTRATASVERAARLNFVGSEIIANDAGRKNGKYVALVGEAHANTHEGGVPGFSQILKAPVISLGDPPAAGMPRPLALLRETPANRTVSAEVSAPPPEAPARAIAGVRARGPALPPPAVPNDGAYSEEGFRDEIGNRLRAANDPAKQLAVADWFNRAAVPDYGVRLRGLAELTARLTDPAAIDRVLQQAARDPNLATDPSGVWSSSSATPLDADHAAAANALNRLEAQKSKSQIRDVFAKAPGSNPWMVNRAMAGLDRFAEILRDRSADQRRAFKDIADAVAKGGPAVAADLVDKLKNPTGTSQNWAWPQPLKEAAAKLAGVDPAAIAFKPRTPIAGFKENPADPAAVRNAWLAEFPDLAGRGKYGLGEDAIPDLSRVESLITSEQRMLEMLQPLNDRVRQLKEQGASSQDALTTALAEKEGRHGFSQAKLIPLGVLPAEVFLKLPALGYVAEDVGAGIEHGDLTHRLQWNAIAEAFDRDLKAWKDGGMQGEFKWKNTPYDLYTGIGERDHRQVLDDQANRPAWERGTSMFAHMMDQAGGNPGEGFRYPDSVTDLFKRLNANADPDFPDLAAAVDERRAARQGDREALMKQLSDVQRETNPERKAKLLQTLDLNPSGNFNLQVEADRLAMERYTVQKMSSSDYVLFDPAHPEQSMLLRKGDAKVAGDQEVAETRKFVRQQFGLPQRPGDVAPAQASDAQLRRLAVSKPVPALPQQVAPSRSGNSSSSSSSSSQYQKLPLRPPGIENQYDKIPEELGGNPLYQGFDTLFAEPDAVNKAPRATNPYQELPPRPRSLQDRQYDKLPPELDAEYRRRRQIEVDHLGEPRMASEIGLRRSWSPYGVERTPAGEVARRPLDTGPARDPMTVRQVDWPHDTVTTTAMEITRFRNRALADPVNRRPVESSSAANRVAEARRPLNRSESTPDLRRTASRTAPSDKPPPRLPPRTPAPRN